MDAQAFDLALTDLETRVDRLRALYENWFRGYEKAEPSVARKEVERKVYAMRKELPRNTALRFRYNQLYQRYTTLSNYWQRTARQIEEGTYRLQVQRLRRRNEAVRGRPDDQELADELDGARDAEPARGLELDLDDDIDVESIFAQVMLDDVEKALSAPGPHVDPVDAAPPRRARTVGTFARPRRPSERPPAAPTPSAERVSESTHDVATAPTVPAPPGLVPSSPTPGTRPGVPAPGPAPLAIPGPEALPAVHIAAARGPMPAGPEPAKSPGLPPPALPPLPPPAAQGPRPPSPLAAGRVAPPPLSLGLSANPADVAARVAATQQAGHGAAPPAGAARPSPPVVGPPSQQPARPAPPTSGVMLREAASPRAPTPPAVPSPPLEPAARLPGAASSARAIPAVPVGAPPPVPIARPRPPVPPPAASVAAKARDIPGGGTLVGPAPTRHAGAGPIDEGRMRRLVDEYNSARKRNNEGDVRYEAVVQSIQRMLPDLERKHVGKRIDFEVVMKDGRVGLKPKAV